LGFPRDTHTTEGAARRKGRFQLSEFPKVTLEQGIFAHAVLETGEIGREFAWPSGRQAINDPVGFTPGLDHPAGTQVGEVFGNLHLRFAQELLNMANAQFTAAEKSEDSQPRFVAKALVDLDKAHGAGVSNISNRGSPRRRRAGIRRNPAPAIALMSRSA
jgi:hypothetical protein